MEINAKPIWIESKSLKSKVNILGIGENKSGTVCRIGNQYLWAPKPSQQTVKNVCIHGTGGVNIEFVLIQRTARNVWRLLKHPQERMWSLSINWAISEEVFDFFLVIFPISIVWHTLIIRSNYKLSFMNIAQHETIYYGSLLMTTFQMFPVILLFT